MSSAYSLSPETRAIASRFPDSAADVAGYYSSDDSGSDSEFEDAEAQHRDAEAQHRSDCHTMFVGNLWDEYLCNVTAAVLRAPLLSEVGFDEYEHVVLFSCQEIRRGDLVRWIAREAFFIRGIDDLVIHALCAALSEM